MLPTLDSMCVRQAPAFFLIDGHKARVPAAEIALQNVLFYIASHLQMQLICPILNLNKSAAETNSDTGNHKYRALL